MDGLQEFLRKHKSKFGTLQDLAAQMRMTYSGFLRAVKKGGFSVENCLLLAEVLGENPAAVFRAADRPDLGDQFERLYGPTEVVSKEERTLIELWRTLAPDEKEHVRSTFTLILRARVGARPDEREEMRPHQKARGDQGPQPEPEAAVPRSVAGRRKSARKPARAS